ncbi:MAG: NAD+ synthase [Candidatus Omnitrophota bacterium]|jgi:NAD+ synthase (glutamine-hydrolysing)
MMKILRVCLAQINPTVGDIAGNSKKIIAFIEEAKAQQADIVVFPELSLSGYPPEDLLLKPHFIKENEIAIQKIAKTSKSIFSVVGYPCLDKGELFNAAALIYNGRLVDIYRKVFLPNYGVFDEQRYFSHGKVCNIVAFGRKLRIGVNICEDIWHAEGPQRTQALLGGAKILINISASPYHTKKIEEREEALRRRAKENNACIFYCNLVGGQDELIFDGGSLVFDDRGNLLARGKQFKEDLISLDLNLDDLRTPIPLKRKVNFYLPAASLKVKFLAELKEKKWASTENRIEKKLEFLDEIYSALALGIKDYVLKNNFSKVVLGLSGGIDSALTAVLAVDALGSDNVVALSMPSKFSTSETRKDARAIAKKLDIKLINVPIGNIYKAYLSSLKGHFKAYKLNTTEENIQARIRGNLLMAFSNKFGWLVLTTGNKSEISTGYCTLYGDMAGGFSVLKDVPKGLVYDLSRFRNKRGKKELIPKSVIDRAPTAELKRNQKDQDTLPPYPILDRIIDLYIEKDISLENIVKRGIDRRIAAKVISMIDRNEYKRRQASPGVKITPKAFGKDRRMPITNHFCG